MDIYQEEGENKTICKLYDQPLDTDGFWTPLPTCSCRSPWRLPVRPWTHAWPIWPPRNGLCPGSVPGRTSRRCYRHCVWPVWRCPVYRSRRYCVALSTTVGRTRRARFAYLPVEISGRRRSDAMHISVVGQAHNPRRTRTHDLGSRVPAEMSATRKRLFRLVLIFFWFFNQNNTKFITSRAVTVAVRTTAL